MTPATRPSGVQRTARTLSVVVPVRDGGEQLRRVLRALTLSDLPRKSWELIVVDDASSDDSPSVAAEYADLVIRLSGQPRGPAYARNRGFETARGGYVAFVDADVLVHPHTLSRMLATMTLEPQLGAVLGTYDAGRTSGRLVSEYRNLLRHVEQQTNCGDVDAFAAGLAIVRSDAFVRAGMFDEWRFQRPLAEGLEFGDRLRALGYGIRRRRDAQATHLKRWTVRQWIWDDVLVRGVSVARLNQLRDFRLRAEGLYLVRAVDASLVWAGVACLVGGIWIRSVLLVALGGAVASGLVLRHRALLSSLRHARGATFAAVALPLHFVTCALYGVAAVAGRALYHAVGEPQPDPVIQAYAEMGIETWPPVPVPHPRPPMDAAPSHPANNGNGARASEL